MTPYPPGTREKGREAQITKLGWKYQHDWIYARNWQSSVSLQVNFFRWRHFALLSMNLIFLRCKHTSGIIYNETLGSSNIKRLLGEQCFTQHKHVSGPEAIKIQRNKRIGVILECVVRSGGPVARQNRKDRRQGHTPHPGSDVSSR
jgi:hypothetical protein